MREQPLRTCRECVAPRPTAWRGRVLKSSGASSGPSSRPPCGRRCRLACRHSPPPCEAASSGLGRPLLSRGAATPAWRGPLIGRTIGLTERRRSRTDRAWGYHTAQVLKSWRGRCRMPHERWPWGWAMVTRHSVRHSQSDDSLAQAAGDSKQVAAPLPARTKIGRASTPSSDDLASPLMPICASCGRDSEGDFRFCPYCAAPLRVGGAGT